MAAVTILATVGRNPDSRLLVDAQGNLIGTTNDDGTCGRGSTFIMPRTAAGYSTTITLTANTTIWKRRPAT